MDRADFIGREALISRILDGDSGRGAFYELRGIAGAGKSALLLEVQRQAAATGDTVVHIQVEEYCSTLDRAAANTAEIDPHSELQRFHNIALAVVEPLLPRQGTDPPGSVIKLRRADGSASGPASVGGGYGGTGFRASTSPNEENKKIEEIEDRVRLAQDAINSLVQNHVEDRRRVFLLVDTFEAVGVRGLRDLLVALFRGLRQVVIVVAQQQVTRDQDFLSGTTATLEITGLTPDEVRRVLISELGPQLGEQLAAAVSRFTDGHALAVGLVADLVKERLRAGEQTDAASLLGLIGQLTAGSSEPGLRLSRLVDKILASVGDRNTPIRKGLDCLWAVRRFDIELLQRLLEADAATEVSDPELVRRLLDYSFVQKRSTPGQPGQVYYVIHQFIRRQGLSDLQTDVQRLQALHHSANDYYEEKTQDHFTEYINWLSYENVAWQFLVREWLYHMANLNDVEQQRARLRLAELFMDAFWWYGSYAPFPFCEELLADWSEMVRLRSNPGLDLIWSSHLREIYNRYPKGWRKEVGDWQTIRQLLLHLRTLAGLDNERNLSDPRVRRLHAQVNYYLAIANQHLNPHDPTIDELLHDAKRHLAADGDQVNDPWMSIHLANAALARGEAQAAVEAVGDVVPLLPESGDWELAANVHRVYADAAWARGDRQLAVDCLARAALSAYRLQTLQGSGEVPYVDEYCQMFLREMHERTVDRMTELIAAGQADIVRNACVRIRAFFDPYWNIVTEGDPQDPFMLLDEHGVQAVVAALFPPPPADTDLDRFDTAYIQLATDVIDRMKRRGAFDDPPGTPLPRPSSPTTSTPTTTTTDPRPVEATARPTPTAARRWWRPRRRH